MRNITNQRIDYRPNIRYTSDYQTKGKTVNEQNVNVGNKKGQLPLDTQSIPSIENNIEYLDSILKVLPLDLQRAIREVYDPIKEVFYEALQDKIVDPNPHPPGIIVDPIPVPIPDPTDPDNPDPTGPDDPGSTDPTDPDDKNPINPDPTGPDDTDPKNKIYPIILRPVSGAGNIDTPGNDNKIHPIILHPIKGNKPGDNPNDKNIHPIVLRPIGKKGDDGDDDPKPIDTHIYPIVLRPIKDSDPGDDPGNDDPGNDDPGDDDITAPYPIILYPIPSKDPNDPDPGDPEDPYPDDPEDPEDPEEGDPGLWDPSDIGVEYLYPDLNDEIDREFVYLLTKLLKHYTEKLKGILNNYYFNMVRCNLGQSEENIKFISNKMELSSNDILNHSKHLLDSSVKNENMAALKTEFFKNVFTIKDSAIHIRSFFVSHELRKRYTDIKYSKGNSMANSSSDAVLTKMNLQYELRYRNSFENLFRYLESSLKVTDDILRLYIQDGLNKSTIVKKGGIK